ncbi:MAG: hypothetical protein AB2L24_00070 [Mangrovibacterium sp.]
MGYLFLLYGLTDLGYGEVAYEMVNKDEYPGWGYMVKNGNTLWEACGTGWPLILPRWAVSMHGFTSRWRV